MREWLRFVYRIGFASVCVRTSVWNVFHVALRGHVELTASSSLASNHERLLQVLTDSLDHSLLVTVCSSSACLAFL
jgi:hypothetical protein